MAVHNLFLPAATFQLHAAQNSLGKRMNRVLLRWCEAYCGGFIPQNP
jgi:hypothetical protein